MILNPAIQPSLQHIRGVSGSTLLNSVDTPSQVHLLPEESFRRTGVSVIEEEVPVQAPEIQQLNPQGENTTTYVATSHSHNEAQDIITESEAAEPDKAIPTREVDRQSSHSGTGNDDAAWEQVIKMIEARHENDFADLQEEHELRMNERHQDIKRLEGHLKQANQRNKRTQLRVNGLLQGHTELKAQVNTSEETLQQAIVASQVLQARYDELEEQYEESKILAQENPPQDPSTRPSQQDTKADDMSNAFGSTNDDVDQLRRAFRAMAADLNQAHAENRLYFAENYGLKRALEQHPERDPGLHNVVQYKDKLLRDLQTTSSEYRMDLEKLQNESSIAYGEITKLRTQLSEKCSSMVDLQSSVQIFKAQSEGILAMLKAKVYPNDLIQAMDGYFQTAIKDNQVLAAGAKRQADLIDEMHETMSMLRADLLQAKTSSDEKDDLCEQLKQDILEKEYELGGLQVKSEALEHDLDQAIQDKDKKIAEMESGMIPVIENLQQMINGTVDERSRLYVQFKEQETARAAARCQATYNENCELQNRLYDLQQQDEFQKCLVYFNDQKHQQVEARLRDAEEELGFLRDENQLQRKLPPTINITTVLAEREELEEARARIRNWEGAQAKAIDSILSLKLLGLQMLLQISRMNNAVKARENRKNFDEVDEYIRQCQETLEAVETYDEDDSSDSEAEVSQEPEAEEAEKPEKPEEIDDSGEWEDLRESGESEESQESEGSEEPEAQKGEPMSSIKVGKQPASRDKPTLQDSVNLTPRQWARKHRPE